MPHQAVHDQILIASPCGIITNKTSLTCAEYRQTFRHVG